MNSNDHDFLTLSGDNVHWFPFSKFSSFQYVKGLNRQNIVKKCRKKIEWENKDKKYIEKVECKVEKLRGIIA